VRSGALGAWPVANEHRSALSEWEIPGGQGVLYRGVRQPQSPLAGIAGRPWRNRATPCEEGRNLLLHVEIYIGYYSIMADGPRLSHTSAMILQAIGIGHIYGYTVMEVTGLPSGTVYPALRRLERDQLIRSQWERQSIADAALRPPRKYYRLTRSGEAALEASRKRYPLLAKLASKEEEVQDV
jgi:DNA-binding PadR family transcriptional regulator